MSKGDKVKIEMDRKQAAMLKTELNKVRCWMTGYLDAQSASRSMMSIAGMDSLRQMEIILGDALQ